MEDKSLLRILRIAFAVTVYLLTVCCYLTPILFAKYWGSRTLSIASPDRAQQSRNWGVRCLSWCNCIAAGIFLAICFLGLIPYSGEKFAIVCKKYQYEGHFPVSESVVVFGFLITLFLEQSFLAWQEHRDTCQKKKDAEQVQGLLTECEMQELLDDPLAETLDDQNEMLVRGIHVDGVLHTQCTNFAEGNDFNFDSAVTSSDINMDAGSRMSLLSRRESGIMFFVVALAAGLHSVFEGLALGLQTDIHRAIHLFLAIILHECLVSVALGVNAIKLHYTFCTYLKFGIFLFSAIPLGLIFGAVVQKAPDSSAEIISAVLQALAAGVFLHVIFQDFFPSVFSNRHDRMLKVLFVAVGFNVIAVITFLIREN